jgi:hypothetical protein
MDAGAAVRARATSSLGLAIRYSSADAAEAYGAIFWSAATLAQGKANRSSVQMCLRAVMSTLPAVVLDERRTGRVRIDKSG